MEQVHDFIELGAASDETRGGQGPIPEFVRDMSLAGIAED